jgi:hypothetical protein
MAASMKPAVAVAQTAQTKVPELPKITAVCRTILAGAVEPAFVAAEIERQGPSIETIESRTADLSSSEVLLFLGNASWKPEIVQQLRALPRQQRPFVAVWHWEPLPPSRMSGIPKPALGIREIGKILLRDPRATDPHTNFSRLRAMLDDGLIDLLAVSTLGRQEFLAEQGYTNEFIPLGSGLEHGSDRGGVRDIDVMFLGDARVPRRKKMLKQLSQRGLNVTIAGSWKDPRYWGKARTALLNRVKILLNVPRTQGDYSGLRLLLGAANGAMILSERLYRPSPFMPGRHYVEAEQSEIPERARSFVADTSARLTITRAASELTTTATRQRSVTRLLRAIADGLAKGRRR